MDVRTLIGAGDRILAATLPVAVVGVAANVAWPGVFHMHLGRPGIVAGWILLLAGVPLWITAVTQVLVHVPRGRLITTGAFALVPHPLYTSVALLVIPGIGLVADTWVALAIGGALYVSSRTFSGRENAALEQTFGERYERYRAGVRFPWL